MFMQAVSIFSVYAFKEFLQILDGFPLSFQLAIQKPISFKDSSTLMQVDQNETSIVVRDEMQNGGFAHAETIIYHSKVVTIIVELL